MSSKIRVEYPGAIYHVLSRGDRREDRFWASMVLLRTRRWTFRNLSAECGDGWLEVGGLA
jgi:hypothetical protein